MAVGVCACVSEQEDNYLRTHTHTHTHTHTGGLVGTLPTEQHRVSGQLYIVDSKTLFIEDFNYDGGGPGKHNNIALPLCIGRIDIHQALFRLRVYVDYDFKV